MADIMDLYTLLLGDSGDAKAEAQAISRALRRERETQGLAALGSADPIGALGAVSQKGAAMDQANLSTGLQARLRYGQERQRHIEQMQHEKLMNAQQLEALKANARLQFRDLGGQYELYRQILENQGKVDAAKEKNAAPPKLKVFSLGEVDKLTKNGQQLNAVRDLRNSFQDKYAGTGIFGDLKSTTGRLLGGAASKGLQEHTNWWARWRNAYELLKKHELFGSAFTNTERDAYKGAQMVTENKSPETVKEGLRLIEKDMNDILSAHVQGREMEGYSGDAAKVYTQGSTRKTNNALESMMQELGI